jgi:hypothetical protein
VYKLYHALLNIHSSPEWGIPRLNGSIYKYYYVFLEREIYGEYEDALG